MYNALKDDSEAARRIAMLAWFLKDLGVIEIEKYSLWDFHVQPPKESMVLKALTLSSGMMWYVK